MAAHTHSGPTYGPLALLAEGERYSTPIVNDGLHHRHLVVVPFFRFANKRPLVGMLEEHCPTAPTFLRQRASLIEAATRLCLSAAIPPNTIQHIERIHLEHEIITGPLSPHAKFPRWYIPFAIEVDSIAQDPHLNWRPLPDAIERLQQDVPSNPIPGLRQLAEVSLRTLVGFEQQLVLEETPADCIQL